MDSVILQGPDAIKAAIYLMDKFGTEAFDLGPDFGQDTARVWLRETPTPDVPIDWIAAVERWRDEDGWFDNIGPDFRVVFDGPPFRMGNDISVVGTPL